jgi:hypothetical protein
MSQWDKIYSLTLLPGPSTGCLQMIKKSSFFSKMFLHLCMINENQNGLPCNIVSENVLMAIAYKSQ